MNFQEVGIDFTGKNVWVLHTYRVMDNNMKTVLTKLGRSWYAGGMKKLVLLALFALFSAFLLMAQDAEFYIERGIEYAESGNHDLALEDFNTAIALDPNHPGAYNSRGVAYYEKGDLERAIEDWTEAIRLKPDYSKAYVNRGLAYRENGQWDQCIEDWNEALKLEPDYPDLKETLAVAYFNRGNTYFEKGEFDRAIEDYTKTINLNENNIHAWFNRGYAYKEKGELDKAIEDYSRAIDLDQNLASVWNNRGRAYSAKGELDRAIEDYTRAIVLDQNLVQAWNNRGIVYYDKGELDRAIEDYTRVIALDRNLAHAWINRGLAYEAKGELDQAIEDYTMAIALDQNLVQSWNNRGNAYSNKGELDLAIEDYSRAIALDPNFAAVWSNRGLAYEAKGELDQAIEDYSRAIALDPNFAAVWSNRGNAYFDKSEHDLAIEDYSRAIALDPNFAAVWSNRGNAYKVKGEFDRAIYDFRQSIEVANKSGNMLDIFFWSWEFAGIVYNTYPFFTGNIYNTFDTMYADLAREALSKSIAKAEKARSTLGARGAQIMISLLYQYYAGVDFEAVFGSAETAFSYSESLRSRGFLEQMGTEAALKLPGVQETDAQNVRRLIRDIDNLRGLLSALNPHMDVNRYAETGIALSRTEAELATLDAAISQRVPRYAELRNPGTSTLAQAMSFCGNNRVILEYVIWDNSVDFKAPASFGGPSSYTDRPSINSYCLVITKDGITAVRLDPEFDYAGNVEALRLKLFRIENRNIIPNDESVFEVERNALYNALIRPVLEHMPVNIENILIVPDSNLAFLPFDILRENNDPDTRSLGERYGITLSPSVSVSILASQTEVDLREPIIAFGGAWYEPSPEKNIPSREMIYYNNRLAALDRRLAEYHRGSAGERPQERMRAERYYEEIGGWDYLSGTVAEVQGLERIATIAPTIIQGMDVSKRRVKELSDAGVLRNYPIVHFACHGYFNDDLMPQAALVFSEVSGLLGDDVDGYLSINEIVLLQLRARMVMLSACQTGLGNLRRGDGMSGLARAFMVAGAQNVGVSLWEIHDAATMEFMWNVYRKVIREGKSFRDAYREVKEEFRRSERWSHPYYWAAFTMYE